VLLDICNSGSVINNLVNNTCHIGIIQEKPDVAGIESVKIASCHLQLVCSKHLTKYKTVSLKEFTQLPIIIREQGSGTRQSLENELQRFSITLDDLNIVLELTSSEAIKTAVFSGRGYALLPELSVNHELDSGSLHEVLIEDAEFKTDFFLAYLKQNPPKGAEKNFYDFIKSSKRGFCT
jgi:DNA-binding transcriptional LysR family regulator